MENLEPADDALFEVQCRKLVMYLKLPADKEKRKRRAKEIFDMLDRDGSGDLALGEMLRLSRKGDPMATEAMVLFFNDLDGGGSGGAAGDASLSSQEWIDGILKVFGHRTDEELDAMFDEMIATIKEV